MLLFGPKFENLTSTYGSDLFHNFYLGTIQILRKQVMGLFLFQQTVGEGTLTPHIATPLVKYKPEDCAQFLWPSQKS